MVARRMSGEAVSIRRAAPTDAAVITQFNCAMALETEGKVLDRKTVAAGVRAVLSDSTKGRYVMAELEGEVVGQTMLTFEWSDWRHGCFWWIQSVYVARQARRCGVFRTLYKHIHNEAKADPTVCGLRLYVHRSNTRAQAAYENLGMAVAPYVLCEEDWSTGYPRIDESLCP